MWRQTIIWGLSACFFQSTIGQEPVEFRDLVYDIISVEKNVSYSKVIIPGTSERFYKADIYEPVGDNLKKRPLIIWLHGGAFKFGSKNSIGTKLWSITFSQRGYVCAAINYQLYKRNPLFKRKSFYKGCYGAFQHVNKALAFFKKNAEKYQIDTNRIILAGNSAGGMIALQYSYSSSRELQKLIDPLMQFDSAVIQSSTVKAVVNFWGAIFNEQWLENARTPIVSVHGKKDKLVPLNNKKNAMSGSLVIHEKADSLHIPNELKVYNNQGHELHTRFHPFRIDRATKRRWLEAGQFAADFLYEQLIEKTEER